MNPEDRRLLNAYKDLTGDEDPEEEAVLEALRAVWKDPSCAAAMIGGWDRFVNGDDSPEDFARRLARIMSPERIEPPVDLAQRVAAALLKWGVVYPYLFDGTCRPRGFLDGPRQPRQRPATEDELASVIRKEMER